MKNQSFSYSSLSRCLYAKDFFENERLRDDEYRKEIVDQALTLANNLFESGINYEEIYLDNKVGYRAINLADKLVLRRCVNNIKTHIDIAPKQRSVIGKELTTFLKEGTPYRIYRLDIYSFFESVQLNDITETLSDFDELSIHTKNIILSYLQKFQYEKNICLPRGIEISPAIADLLLKKFDGAVRRHNEVFYYSRFVDDIIIITSCCEDEKIFTRWLSSNLVGNLRFNHNKKQVITVLRRSRALNTNTGTNVAIFNFLGYEYTVTDTDLTGEGKNAYQAVYRRVLIDISKKKVGKIKEKISKSLYNHYKNNNFGLLYDRIYFLISNRDMKDNNKKRTIPTGIYYNYSLIEPTSTKLIELDDFLNFSILSSNSRLGNITHNSLTTKQKKKILKLSFCLGFKDRIYKKFSPNRLKEITKIW